MPDGKSKSVKDQVLVDIVEYVDRYEIKNANAYTHARLCLMDAMGCAIESLKFPECAKLLGPMVPGQTFENGVRIPGTQFELDPISASFNIATMIRWLDFNDAFSAMEGGHSSDNIGAILAVADYSSRMNVAQGKLPLTMRDVLTATIKAYEIQGILSLENSFSLLGFDYITFARVAATAVVTKMLGGNNDQLLNAISNAFADGASLKIYRQNENTGSRKSWAGGDAAARAIWHAFLALRNEMGYHRVLTAKTFGLYDAIFKGKPFSIPMRYGTFAIENVMFKFVPAGMEGQTATECALKLHPLVKDKLGNIEAIEIRCHDKMIRMMDKKGPLTNPADRDHCTQYIVAVALLHGKVATTDFEDGFAADPRIDILRSKMSVVEDPAYTKARLDPAKRSNASAIKIRFKDGVSTPLIEVEYPLGHVRRRPEAIPALEDKFKQHIGSRYAAAKENTIAALFSNQARLEALPVQQFMEFFAV